MSGIIGGAGSKSGVIGDTEMEHDFSGALDIVGMIAPFAMAAAPTGWIICNGAAISRTVTYAALFGVIGTVWGVGNGSSTFNLPDLEGAFLRGTGTSTLFTQDSTTTLAAAVDDQAQDHGHFLYTQTKGLGWSDLGANANYRQVEHVRSHDFSVWLETGEPRERDSQGTPRKGNETRPNHIGVTYHIKY